jgi:hypothetical protein
MPSTYFRCFFIPQLVLRRPSENLVYAVGFGPPRQLKNFAVIRREHVRLRKTFILSQHDKAVCELRITDNFSLSRLFAPLFLEKVAKENQVAVLAPPLSVQRWHKKIKLFV